MCMCSCMCVCVFSPLAPEGMLMFTVVPDFAVTDGKSFFLLGHWTLC